MTNLFSIFDPISAFNYSINWISSILIIFFLPCFFWTSPNQMFYIVQKSLLSLYQELQAIFSKNSTPGIIYFSITLFGLILLNNFMGLFPYVFTSSSHLVFTLSLALPLWLGHMSMAWFKMPSFMCAHLVPLGTPNLLIPFMVLIEMVSNSIRPLTLTVRLAANMIAGHLLLTLLSSLMPYSSFMIFFCLIISLTLLLLLELAVALIQSYVFSVLSTLYLNEVNQLKLNTY